MTREVSSIDLLAASIIEANSFFLHQVQRQVNVALTLRNWLIGHYIMEYEQYGKDRATYGNKLLYNLASRLKKKGIRGMSGTNLKLFRRFYDTYPEIGQTLSDQLTSIEPGKELKLRTASAKPGSEKGSLPPDSYSPEPELLLNRLSFSHFIELLKANTVLKRNFYEIQTLKITGR